MSTSILLTTRQAAELCNLSRRTLEKYRVDGGGPIYVKIKGNVRYRPKDIDTWLAENLRRSTSDDRPPEPSDSDPPDEPRH
jgi:predicted DNA-binding transcriptional regulator AlpA